MLDLLEDELEVVVHREAVVAAPTRMELRYGLEDLSRKAEELARESEI